MEAINWRQTWNNRAWREGMISEITTDTSLESKELTLKIRKNIDDDTVSYSTYWQVIISPKFYRAAYIALRITLLVVLPLMLLSDHFPNFFKIRTILALFGIVNSQETVGEQVAMVIMVLQVLVWMLIWGTVVHATNLISHPIAWWITVFSVAFILSLFGDLRCRRLAILLTILLMAAQWAYPNDGYLLPFLMCRDLLIALLFAFAQAFVPPLMMSKRVDNTMAEAFVYVGEVVRNAAKASWSPNPIEAVEALTKTTLKPLQRTFTTLAPQLDIVRYEPYESTLRWQLRNERMDLLHNMMPMLKALSGATHELHFLQQSRQYQEEDSDSALSVKNVLRGRLDEALGPFLDALNATLEQLGRVLKPEDVMNKVPFDDLKETTSQLQSAIDKIHFDVMSFRISSVEPVWYMHIIFAHLMMVLLGEELLKYSELMLNFDRSRYLSTRRCMLNFF